MAKKESFIKISLGAFSLVAAGLFLCSQTTSPKNADEKPSKDEVVKVSQAFGQLIGKQMRSGNLTLDYNEVIKGLKSAAKGDQGALSEAECIKTITLAHQKAFQFQATSNLKTANKFLEENKKNKNVHSLDEGKVQFIITKQGKGLSVQPHQNPLVKFTGKFVDGTIFSSSKEAEALALDEAIPGIAKGIIGMKEGEKRVVYIHPDLAYGTKGPLPPNSLLTFEVELIQVNASNTDQEKIREHKKFKYSPEIAVSQKSESYPR